jgi:hypothetical protein
MEQSLVLKKKNALEKRRKTTATVGGTPEDIYRDVMESKFRNLFQSMYKSLVTSESTCEHCGSNKRLERCHAGKTRKQIGLKAIRDAPVNEYGMRSVHDILVNFVSLHSDEPVKILCQTCHRKFDAKPKEKALVKPKEKALSVDWKIEIRIRQSGKSAGKRDTYYHAPDGRVFRSYVTACNAPTGCRPRVAGSCTTTFSDIVGCP